MGGEGGGVGRARELILLLNGLDRGVFVGATGPVVEFDVEQARKVFDTNVFAPSALLSLLFAFFGRKLGNLC